MLLFRRRRSPDQRKLETRPTVIELLESRCLLSTSIPGFTPQEIRHAYGFDQISLGDGITADGSGQTIAIVDAYNDPKVASDLAVFDQQFGLTPADLTVVNQAGGSKLPQTDSGWAGEITLDVEWAHAIAPGARILLVEADSSSIDDLMTAVDYARNVDGVSTVSMSWGGSEFFSWTGGESASQTDFDPIFTTPSGHQGVTFLAAAGDSGAISGVQWPSSSPNVISVGGTSLFTSDDSGTYDGETGWSGTNGGFSQVENEPSYQASAQLTGIRTTPDVSYDADPNTGFAVYDSLAFDGASGWQEVGGTSAGAPQWAALIAIADQGRALKGLNSLDGPSQTLPALYGMYGDPTTSDYSTYASTFDDVLSGGGTLYRHRWGGITQTGYSAAAGYDLVTGLGSPQAASVVAALVGTSSAPPTGSQPAEISSPIEATFATEPLNVAIGGKRGEVKLTLTNTSGAKFNGPVTVKLLASTDSSVSADDTQLVSRDLNHLKLKSGHSKTITLHFAYPAGAAGTYDFVASVAATSTNAPADTVIAPSSVTVVEPTVDLSSAFIDRDGLITVHRGKSRSVTIAVTNLGNVTAHGDLTFTLDAFEGATDELLKTKTKRNVKIRPGATVEFRLKFRASKNLTPGNYEIVANTTSTARPADNNSSNDGATIETAA